jgi:hypothetical protein
MWVGTRCVMQSRYHLLKMAANLTFYTSLSAEAKWIGDRWCAVAKELPLHAYGTTAQEASARLTEALDALVKTLMIVGGKDQVDEFMTRAGITYEISDCSPDAREPVAVVVPFMRSLDAD